MSRLSAIALVLLAAGCGRSMRWEYELPSGLEGADMVARVRSGGCAGGTIVYEQPFTDGGPAVSGPVLGAGTYGVELEVLGDACDVVARGCEEVTLPGGDVVRVNVAAITPEAACSADRCIEGVCMRFDAGMPDAGGPIDTGGTDVPSTDAGTGDECGPGTECGCGDECIDGWCVPDRPVSTVEAARAHVCAITEGVVFCWGNAGVGELGTGSADWNRDSSVPLRVAQSNWTDISTSGNTTCGVADGTMYCWGSNYVYQGGVMPDGGATENLLGGPTLVEGSPITATRFASGAVHTLAIDGSGRLAGWGRNDQGAVRGAPLTTADPGYLPPTAIDGTWRTVAAGDFFSCGIDTESRLLCWGADLDNRVGRGTSCGNCDPGEVGGPSRTWAGVELGYGHACAWDVDGALYCWGRGNGISAGALGGGDPQTVSTPQRVPDLVARAAGLSLHTCVIDVEGQLFCFGPNESGQLGVGDLAMHLSPERVEGRGWIDVSAGSDFTCGVRQRGALYCWGNGENNVLAQTMPNPDGGMPVADITDRNRPTRVCIP